MGALRVGLIGVGKHGQRYARHIRDDLPEVQLVALARRDAAQSDTLRSESGYCGAPARANELRASLCFKSLYV